MEQSLNQPLLPSAAKGGTPQSGMEGSYRSIALLGLLVSDRWRVKSRTLKTMRIAAPWPIKLLSRWITQPKFRMGEFLHGYAIGKRCCFYPTTPTEALDSWQRGLCTIDGTWRRKRLLFVNIICRAVNISLPSHLSDMRPSPCCWPHARNLLDLWRSKRGQQGATTPVAGTTDPRLINAYGRCRGCPVGHLNGNIDSGGVGMEGVGAVRVMGGVSLWD